MEVWVVLEEELDGRAYVVGVFASRDGAEAEIVDRSGADPDEIRRLGDDESYVDGPDFIVSARWHAVEP